MRGGEVRMGPDEGIEIKGARRGKAGEESSRAR